MPTDNIYTEIIQEMQEELRGLRENRKPATPFMQERLKPSALRKRIDKMTPGDRKELLGTLGREATLKILRGQ